MVEGSGCGMAMQELPLNSLTSDAGHLLPLLIH